MDFAEFNKAIQHKSEEIKKAIEKDLLLKIESEALRYVDDNFRNQGYEGTRWKESDGTILVKTSTLKRGFESEMINGAVKITNAVPYAKIHNEGSDIEVNVPAHTRNVFKTSKGKKTKKGKVNVKAFKRNLKMPQRQFAPLTENDHPTLNKNIIKVVETTINHILNK